MRSERVSVTVPALQLAPLLHLPLVLHLYSLHLLQLRPLHARYLPYVKTISPVVPPKVLLRLVISVVVVLRHLCPSRPHHQLRLVLPSVWLFLKILTARPLALLLSNKLVDQVDEFFEFIRIVMVLTVNHQLFDSF